MSNISLSEGKIHLFALSVYRVKDLKHIVVFLFLILKLKDEHCGAVSETIAFRSNTSSNPCHMTFLCAEAGCLVVQKTTEEEQRCSDQRRINHWFFSSSKGHLIRV